MRDRFQSRMLSIGMLALALALSAVAAQAHSTGISGHSITGCNMCHAGSPLPTSVAITGPTSVASGSTNTYTFTVNGGAAVVGGLDVSHSVGTFAVNDSGTQLMANEITHNAPRAFNGSSVSWTMSWTAPVVTANTAATLYASGVSSDDSGAGGGSLSTSLPITVTASVTGTAPSITTQPANQSVTAGQTATFSVVAAGTAPLSYQWTKSGATIAGATSASYTTPATAAADSGATFAVTVTNSAGSVTSSAATLTVNAASTAPTITTQPASQSVTAGQTATFSVVAAGTAPLSYQWTKSGATIAGATSASYTTPATTATDSGATFAAKVTNSAGSVTSSAATLTVNAASTAPTITTQPASQSVTVGQTATFTVVAAGTAPLSYQWTKSGATIAGATSASYMTPATAAADNGATFAVKVTNTLGSVTSSSATLTVAAAGTSVVPSSSHVFLVVEENHSYASVIGSSLMPYLNALANNYGLATQYFADVHPSIGNYFMLTTGQTVSGDETQTPATLPVASDNLVRELMASGKTWKAYMEDLPSVGYMGGNSANYLVYTNPFAYLTDVSNSSSEQLNLVPFSQFAIDLANNQLPNFSYLKPNIMNDGENGTLDAADLWLRNNIALLLASPAFQQDGILIITFDESVDSDTAHGGGQVATVVISPRAISGKKSTTLYQHENVLRTVLTALGASTFPGAAATATPMAEFFSATANTAPPAMPPTPPTPPKPFQMSVPATASGVRGQPITLNISIAPQNGFNGPVTLSCSGLPAGATYAWSANPVTPMNGTASSTLTIMVPTTVAAVQPRTARPMLAMTLPMLGLALGSAALGRKRKQRALWILLGIVMVMVVLGGVACGTGSTGHTTAAATSSAQAFTVTITATSGTTTATSTVAVNLN